MPKRTQTQTGGLPPVTDVAVPFGLTLIAHWLSDSQEDTAIRRLERYLAQNYDRLVETLPPLPSPVAKFLERERSDYSGSEYETP